MADASSGCGNTAPMLVWLLLSIGVVVIFAVTYVQRNRGRRRR
jgi:hypothetical protein